MAAEKSKRWIVVLGTGGTIAGTAARAGDNLGYTAAQVGVAQLLAGIAGLPTALQGRELATEQVAQVDSKDMDGGVWVSLLERCAHWLAQDEVQGLVITHGTDTLEETAYLLHSVLQPARPVVLTCAMRPASALAPDGPQNLLDAVAVAATPGAQGVLAVCAGTVHGALEVQKVHPYRLDAFSSGEAGPLGYVEEGVLRLVRPWPAVTTTTARERRRPESLIEVLSSRPWPRVEIVMNHAGAGRGIVDALLDQNAARPGDPVRGIIAAGTGNGSLHRDLEAALLEAVSRGIEVRRATRCAEGRVLPVANQLLPDSQGLSPVKARIALMLELVRRDQRQAAPAA